MFIRLVFVWFCWSICPVGCLWADMPAIVTAKPVTAKKSPVVRATATRSAVADKTKQVTEQAQVISRQQHRLHRTPLKRKGAAAAIIVVLDPGHGGKDWGARGLYRAREKDINLQMARRIKYYLEQHRGFKVILTRSDDRYCTRQQRVNVARRHRAKLFISLHSDAYRRQDVRGVTIFSLSPSGTVSVASRWLSRAERELVSTGEVQATDPSVRTWLTDLSSRSMSQASTAAGNAILRAISNTSKLHRPRIEYANFWVLKAPHVPSLLIETGFISNPQEAKLLMRPSYRDGLAKAIAKGIVQYFNN